MSESNAPVGTTLTVSVSIQRGSDGKYFNGTSWSATPTFFPTTVDNGVWVLPAGVLPGGANGQPVGDGKYTLTAVATDNNGQRASAVVTLTLDHTAPTITITTPATPTVLELTTIAGKATDATGGTGVKQIIVFLIRVADGKAFNGTAFVTPLKIQGVPQLPALTTGYDPQHGIWARRAGLPTAAQLTPGNYRILAVAIDGAGNRGQATRSFSVPAPASTVALSTATASVAGDSVALQFSGALEAESASDAAHYSVTVNGKAVTIESAGYNATSHSVTLELATGVLKTGDKVVIKWSGLSDSKSATVAGESGNVTAR